MKRRMTKRRKRNTNMNMIARKGKWRSKLMMIISRWWRRKLWWRRRREGR